MRGAHATVDAGVEAVALAPRCRTPTVRRCTPARPDELPWVAAVPLPLGRAFALYRHALATRCVSHDGLSTGVGRRRAGGTATASAAESTKDVSPHLKLSSRVPSCCAQSPSSLLLAFADPAALPVPFNAPFAAFAEPTAYRHISVCRCRPRASRSHYRLRLRDWTCPGTPRHCQQRCPQDLCSSFPRRCGAQCRAGRPVCH